ncbi:MAG: hypothetical protein GXO90_02895 [FCB group bacterium]|nr:hypothetical protein [FCB group bacterium]
MILIDNFPNLTLRCLETNQIHPVFYSRGFIYPQFHPVFILFAHIFHGTGYEYRDDKVIFRFDFMVLRPINSIWNN